MATTLTHFEVEQPLQYADGTSQANAIQTFKNNMISLGPIWERNETKFDSTGFLGSVLILSGFLTAAQQTLALGYLNTLNAALPTPVLCVVHTVTSEP